MENTGRIATHHGLVVGLQKGSVEVRIQAVSACATCAAHAKCGFADTKDKQLLIPTPDWQRYALGDTVLVHIDQQRGLLAVWIAYLLPSILILAAIAAAALAHWPEWAIVLAAFATLGVYTGALYLRRRRLSDKFTLTLEPCSY